MKAMTNINHLTRLFSNFGLIILIIIVFSQVFSRYVLQFSLPWSEELARYLMVWLTFLGAALAVTKDAHPRVIAFVNLLPAKARKPVLLASFLVSGLFYALLVYYGCIYSLSNLAQPSPVLRIPMGYVFTVIPISGLLLFLNNFVIMIQLIKSGEQ